MQKLIFLHIKHYKKALLGPFAFQKLPLCQKYPGIVQNNFIVVLKPFNAIFAHRKLHLLKIQQVLVELISRKIK